MFFLGATAFAWSLFLQQLPWAQLFKSSLPFIDASDAQCVIPRMLLSSSPTFIWNFNFNHLNLNARLSYKMMKPESDIQSLLLSRKLLQWSKRYYALTSKWPQSIAAIKLEMFVCAAGPAQWEQYRTSFLSLVVIPLVFRYFRTARLSSSSCTRESEDIIVCKHSSS